MKQCSGFNIFLILGYTCSARERMMYLSCKAPFLEKLQAFVVEIVKKLEIDNGTELTTDFLQDELHLKKFFTVRLLPNLKDHRIVERNV
ncbi:twinfilin-like [Glossina fuscipes fuscipes]